MTCLLCSRQFKTVDMLKKHSNQSDLHKVIILPCLAVCYLNPSVDELKQT
jgi:hypothetical protein